MEPTAKFVLTVGELGKLLTALRKNKHTCFADSPAETSFGKPPKQSAVDACMACGIGEVVGQMEIRHRQLTAPKPLDLLQILDWPKFRGTELRRAGYEDTAIAHGLRGLREMGYVEVVESPGRGEWTYRLVNDASPGRVKKYLDRVQKQVDEERSLADARERLGYG